MSELPSWAALRHAVDYRHTRVAQHLVVFFAGSKHLRDTADAARPPELVDLLQVVTGGVVSRHFDSALDITTRRCLRVVVQKMLDAGVDPNYNRGKGWTALIVAARAGLDAVVAVLLAAGADVNAERPVYKNTALADATASGHVAIVATLLAAGAVVDPVDHFGMTPLHNAASLGLTAIVRLLLAAGANVATPTRRGDSALVLAAQRGHVAVVEWLVTSDAMTIDHLKEYGHAALRHAAVVGSVEIVALLHAAGVNVHHVNSVDSTALMLAARTSVDVVEKLLELGVRVDTADRHGLTALAHASAAGQAEVVELLLSTGRIDHVDQANRDGITPLMMAARGGHGRVVEQLLAWGANVNHVSGNRFSPLVDASEVDKVDVVVQLLAAGADVSRGADRGHSAFFQAVLNGSVASVDALLKHGVVDVNETNEAGDNAMAMASLRGNPQMLRRLRELIGMDQSSRGPTQGGPFSNS